LVRKYEKGFVEVQVSDNGVGIEEEYLKKIFSMGFTTKSKGHGFGLHMSAIAAREMGGELTVESYGKNKGATFTLKFPIEHTGN
jgi:signal transduction histidine kinase